MLKKYKKIIDDFQLKAHPVEMTNYIMQIEIINLLKEIRKELRDLNKE